MPSSSTKRTRGSQVVPSFDEYCDHAGEEISKLMEDYDKNIVPFAIKSFLMQIEEQSGRALDQKYRDGLTHRTLEGAETKDISETIQDLMNEARKFEKDEDIKILMDPSASQAKKMAALNNKVKKAEGVPVKMESSFDVDKSAKDEAVAFVIELVLKFIGSTPDDPIERLNDFARSLKTEKRDLRIPKEFGLEKWQEKVNVCKAIDPQYTFEGLSRYYDAAVEYRKLFGDNDEEADKFKDATSIIATGTDIMQMSFAISLRGQYGVVALAKMGLTVAKIQQMTEDEKATFITVLSPTLADGAIKRMVLAHMADVVDVVVEALIPVLERAFTEKVKRPSGELGDVLASWFVPAKKGMDFGVKMPVPQTGEMEVMHMPDDRIVHGSLPLSWTPKLTSLLNGKIKINLAAHRQGMGRSQQHSERKMAAYLKHFGLMSATPAR